MDAERFNVAMTVLLQQDGGIPIKAWDHMWLGVEQGTPFAKVMYRLAEQVVIDYYTDANGVESENRRVWLDSPVPRG
jgi:hypothetical protein